jgi:glycosyltransferase involved in cell wall biosynthesis
MPLHFAGTEIYVQTLAKLQKAAGHDVAILVPHFDYYHPGKIDEHYIYEEIDVYQYLETSDPRDKAYAFERKLPMGLKEFEHTIDLLKPDIVHFHTLTRSIGLGVEHIKLVKQRGAKILFTMHLVGNTCNTSTLIEHNKSCDGEILTYRCSICSLNTFYGLPDILAVPLTAMGMLFDRLNIADKLPLGKATTLSSMPSGIKRIQKFLGELVEYVDQFVALADWYRDILVINGIPAIKIKVIPQALTYEASGVRQTRIRASLPVKIAFVGRIQIQKGVHLLIDAMKQFPAEQAIADIYGMPEETSYYKECIVKSEQVSSINWKGWLKRDDVPATLANYDIICIPSVVSEMSPMVIQEAFASGTPVLASNVHGNAEQIIAGVNGWLFEFNNSTDLAKKINLLVKTPSLIEEARGKIDQPPGFGSVAAAYEKIYKTV